MMAEVILARRLICLWHAFVKGINSCLACHHAVLIIGAHEFRVALQQHRDALI